MAIDYSKWDKIELSDDSDIEVHPNVDKKSFIKWKQRDIHEKRAQRDHDIKTLTVQMAMYHHLNQRVDHLLKLSDAELCLETQRKKALDSAFVKGERYEGEDTPTYDEMIEDLFGQITEDMVKDHEEITGPALRLRVVAHRAKIDAVLVDQAKRLAVLKEEKSHHISSDDIHTGFDSSFMNKDETVATKSEGVSTKVVLNPGKKTATAPAATAAPAASATTPAAAAPAASAATPAAAAPASQAATPAATTPDELSLLPETERFSYINPSNLVESAQYLNLHPFIATEQQKDALIMTAFNAQLEKNPERAHAIVHQSLLLQYAALLAGMSTSTTQRDRTVQTQKAIKMLFSKLMVPANNAALRGFHADVERTVAHIRERCKVIAQEQPHDDEEGDAIQLKSLDPNTELVVNLPDAFSTNRDEINRYNAFLRLPIKMQEAVRTGSLDAINEVFLHMPTDDAEDVLEIFDESGVIGINAVLENEDEFHQLQEQYNREHSQQGEATIEELSPADSATPHEALGNLELAEPVVLSTADVVD